MGDPREAAVENDSQKDLGEGRDVLAVKGKLRSGVCEKLQKLCWIYDVFKNFTGKELQLEH